MVRINLLPKEEKVKRRIGIPRPSIKMPTGIENYLGIGLVILVIIILSVIHIGQKKTMAHLKTNIAETRLELRKLDEVVKLVKELDKKKKDLDARIEIIRDLNRGRFEKTQFLYRLSSLIPDYCWIQSMEVRGQAIVIKGITFSNQVIADFMKRLQAEKIFRSVELMNIVGKEIEKHSVMEFDLHTTLVSESSPSATKAPPKAKAAKSKQGGKTK
ncbi:MAG: hypothetical protein E3J87_09930 [Candidatus Cloacimonadota bacterium]|nr:MAG: hypothetical protein E3J87_09930 [Candidatus Cloacimonadota bacterium]